MLNESEWEELAPYLQDMARRVKDYRERTGASIGTALEHAKRNPAALAKYYALTGFLETNVNALWHHRLSLYGPPCPACGRLLRTPRARFCAECGHRVVPQAS